MAENENRTWNIVNERMRRYLYPDGQIIRFNDVVAVSVSESGTHRLELANGKKVIVAAGWRAIVFEADAWTF